MRATTDPCEHVTFEASVEVNRLTGANGTVKSFIADIRVWCTDCDEPFDWMGLPAGLSPRHPSTSVDGQELRAPLRPRSAPPDFGVEGPGFHVRVTP